MISERILEKFSKYPDDVRELAIRAITLSESPQSETAIADQLQSVVRKLSNQQECEK
jgi:flagellin-like hook-associated protein FlgL